jgi:hypothetical protein
VLAVSPEDSDNISPLTNDSNQTKVRYANKSPASKNKDYLHLVKDCTTEVANCLSNRYKDFAKLPNKCLQKIIDEKETKYKIILGSKANTIRSCIFYYNLSKVNCVLFLC